MNGATTVAQARRHPCNTEVVTIRLALAVLCLACTQTSDEHRLPDARNIGVAVVRAAAVRQGGPFLEDVTEASGLDFSHDNGASGELLLPEITGAGGALFDYDNDGDLDLYLVQGAPLGGAEWTGSAFPTDRLYRNTLGEPGGTVRFEDVTERSGILAGGYGMGAATGDIDNDGWVDLYVTNLGPNQLWRNQGDGRFVDVTADAGVGDGRWSTSATFLDYDQDGWLDLFVASYVNFSIEMTVECFSRASARDYCGPDVYDPIPDRLYRNRGDGSFEDVTLTSGIAAAFGAGLGVIAADFDGDEWSDIYVANDGDANQLWVNDRQGRFADEALLAGVAFNHLGQAEAGMGVDAADFDGDGDEDLFVTNLEGESNTLYVNLGEGFFEDRTIAAGLHIASLPYTGFGAGFLDYDNDGSLDVLVLNGAVGMLGRQARDGVAYPLRQPDLLFRQGSSGRFDNATSRDAPALERPDVGRGAAFGDVDNDGDIDVVLVNNNGPTRLLVNRRGTERRWVGLRLVDRLRDSLQSRVEVVDASGRSHWRRVRADGSYCTAGDPRIVVGLNDAEGETLVRVHWAGGGHDEFAVQPGRYWLLERGETARALTTER